MNGNFRRLLDEGDIVKALYPDGTLFEIDGIQYYQYKDGGVPTRPMRFHQFAETNFEHEQWAMNRESMQAYIQLFKEFTMNVIKNAGNPDEIQKLAADSLVITTNVQQRITHYSTIEFVYDIAAIIYFTEDEDPFTYDNSTANEKKRLWRQFPELFTFFLSMDLRKHVPLEKLSQQDTLISAAAKIAETLSIFHKIQLESESRELTPATMKFIDSQVETQKEYATCMAYLLRNITTSSQLSGQNK